MSTSNKRCGFTLIELLTVIAIIALLVGILVPSLSAARTAARKSATNGLIDAIGKGAEMFNSEFGNYPQSRGMSPFHGGRLGGGGAAVLFGAQWAALQLSGADLQGYVDPEKPSNDAIDLDRGVINARDWNEWYSLKPKRKYTRSGPYVDARQGKTAATLNQLIEDSTILDYDKKIIVKPTHSKWFGTGDLPVYVDSWKRPVLYYRANVGAGQAYTTGVPGSSNFAVGLYDQSDNGGFTGSDGQNGQFALNLKPMRFQNQSVGQDHELGVFNYKPTDDAFPQRGTFEYWFTDPKVFEMTKRGNKGKITPFRPDSFIIISAGPDGVYGSADDLRNFTR